MATKKTTTKKIKIQDAPCEGNFTREEIQAAVKAARKPAVKKNIDPGRPVSRPMAPISTNSGWGQPLAKEELLGLIDRIHAKQAERERLSKIKK